MDNLKNKRLISPKLLSSLANWILAWNDAQLNRGVCKWPVLLSFKWSCLFKKLENEKLFCSLS